MSPSALTPGRRTPSASFRRARSLLNKSALGARDFGAYGRGVVECKGAATQPPWKKLLRPRRPCAVSFVPDGSVEAFLADHRGDLFADEMFEDLFPSRRGRPSVPADVVASVTWSSRPSRGLSDHDAARALRDRISWKVACGLALTDEGFDFSVLTYWRTRLRRSEEPERIFDAVRAVIDATGVLKGKTRRALDSTLLDDAVATKTPSPQLIAAIRRVRRIVPGTLDVALGAHDYESRGQTPHCLG